MANRAAIAIGLAVICVFAFTYACGEDDNGATPRPTAPESRLQEAVEKMEALASYRMVIVDHSPPQSLPHAVGYVVDIDRDGGYRTVGEMVDGPTTHTCEEVPGGERCEPDPPATFTEGGVVEVLVFEDRLYFRDCVAQDRGCEGWSDGEPHFLWYPQTGPGWFMPEFPLSAARSTEEVVFEETSKGPDIEDIRLRSTFDYLKAVTDALQEFRNAYRDVPGVEEAALDVTDEDLQESSTHLFPVDIFIDRDTGLLSHMSMFLPAPDSDNFEELYEVEIVFSHFDEVTVQQPR